MLFKIGRAFFAQSRLGVPADLRADPLAAARALFEIAFGLFDRFFERRVVRLAASGALNLVSAVAGVRKDAAEQIAGSAQQSARRPGQRRLKARHIAVAAFVTVKLELEAPICRQIIIICRESNHCPSTPVDFESRPRCALEKRAGPAL